MGLISSEVTRQIEIAHHNGPEGSKCQRNHGHSLKVVVSFMYDDKTLDDYGQGPDFSIIKRCIENFDHQDLNIMMDEPPSMELFAKVLFGDLASKIGMRPRWVQVTEGGTQNVITYHG